jgi:ATP-dependent DNA helicase RecG
MVPPSPTPVNFERSPVYGVECDDLDQESLHIYLRHRAPQLLEAVPPERLAASLGLLAPQSGKLVPSVAGMVLFGLLPQMAHPEWGLVAVRIRGTRLSDPLAARLDIEGKLQAMLEGVLLFVKEHAANVPNLVDPTSLEPEYPRVAVREAILNALVHRDYRLSGRVTLRIFDDRLEVWSPGGMPIQLSLEHLAQHGGVSFPRNPILASSARALGLIEQIGRGLTTIRRTMAEVTTQPASFAASPADFLVTLPSRLQHRPPVRDGN